MKITKTFLYLLAIFILALSIRIFSANTIDVGTDEMIYSIIPLNIISAGRLGTVEQSPLAFYLNDFGYTLSGGIGPISARLPSIIFGSLAIFVIYLLAYQLTQDKKSSLLSAFIYSLSGFITYNITEMDTIAFFFMLLSTYFFILSLQKNIKYLYFTTTFFVLAILTKNLVLLFFPAYAIIYILHLKKQHELHNTETGKYNLDKKYIKTPLFCLILFLFLLLPVFSYNYLIHTEKGISDYYFSNILGYGETVHKGMQNKPWEFSKLISTTKDILKKIVKWDSLLLIAGIGAMIILYKKRTPEIIFFILSNIAILIYIGGQTASTTHFLWLPFTLSIFAGYAITKFSEKITQKYNWSHTIKIVILLIILITPFHLYQTIEKNQSASTVPLWKFVHENIPENAIVVIDPRIYRGIHAWVFNDKHYLDGTYFNALQQQLQQLEKNPTPKEQIPLYYIECGEGSHCGWKPEDMERIAPVGKELSKTLTPQMTKVNTLNTKYTTFIIYKNTITAPTQIYNAIDQTHIFWFYPIGWKNTENIIDDYTPKGMGIIINILGYLTLYLVLLISLLSIPFTIYLTLKKTTEF